MSIGRKGSTFKKYMRDRHSQAPFNQNSDKIAQKMAEKHAGKSGDAISDDCAFCSLKVWERQCINAKKVGKEPPPRPRK